MYITRTRQCCTEFCYCFDLRVQKHIKPIKGHMLAPCLTCTRSYRAISLVIRMVINYVRLNGILVLHRTTGDKIVGNYRNSTEYQVILSTRLSLLDLFLTSGKTSARLNPLRYSNSVILFLEGAY